MITRTGPIFIIFILFFSFITNSYSQNIFQKRDKNVKIYDEIEKKTIGYDVFDGLFKIYQNKKDGNAYLEIDTSHLDKEFIHFSERR